MLCRLHTVYKIIHCVTLHTLCDITQSVSNHTVKWSIFCVTSGKNYTCQKKLHGHCPWRPWQISGMPQRRSLEFSKIFARFLRNSEECLQIFLSGQCTPGRSAWFDYSPISRFRRITVRTDVTLDATLDHLSPQKRKTGQSLRMKKNAKNIQKKDKTGPFIPEINQLTWGTQISNK